MKTTSSFLSAAMGLCLRNEVKVEVKDKVEQIMFTAHSVIILLTLQLKEHTN